MKTHPPGCLPIGFIILLLAIIISMVVFSNTKEPLQTCGNSLTSDNTICQINNWRISQGRRSYTVSPDLCFIANARVLEIKKDWSHNGFWKYTKSGEFQAQAENIARNYTTTSGMVEAWLASPDHRKNLDNTYKYSCIICSEKYCVHEMAL